LGGNSSTKRLERERESGLAAARSSNKVTAGALSHSLSYWLVRHEKWLCLVYVHVCVARFVCLFCGIQRTVEQIRDYQSVCLLIHTGLRILKYKYKLNDLKIAFIFISIQRIIILKQSCFSVSKYV